MTADSIEKQRLEINETELVDTYRDSTKLAIVEKEIGVLEACRLYPKEIFWCAVFCLGVVMAGYDGQIIASFYALPAFQKRFGSLASDGSYQISAPWQTALGMGSPIGQVIGTLCVAWPLEWFGRKITYTVVNLGVIALIFMQFFAPSLAVLTAGEILCGIFWGCLVLIGPLYASEVAQIKLRGILTAMTNLSFVIGQFVANGVATGFSTNETEWAYKVPFAIQWVWPVLILVMLPFAPESPYWLVRHDRIDEARKAIRQIANKSVSDDIIEERLLLVIETDKLEQEMEQTTSYADIFKGSNLRRTEICSVVYIVQVLCGVPFAMNYSTYFFEIAGFEASRAFDLSLGSTAIGFAATCFTGVALSYIGRRPLYIYGLGFTTLLLFIIGFLDIPKDYTSRPALANTQAALTLIWSFAYQLTAGPLCFVLNGEIPSTKLRSKTIAFATAAQAIVFIAATVAVPYMMNPDNGNLRGKTGFIFAAFSSVFVVWAYFRLPETADRSFEELDIMFHNKVPTRRFASYAVELPLPDDVVTVTVATADSNEKGNV
jgi:SP family general alpha glucoside:H+ symporter-like MFS transporter